MISRCVHPLSSWPHALHASLAASHHTSLSATWQVLVMECLLEVPIDNLQAPEVANIVNIVADCDNLTVGRTEEILSHAFAIMQKLAVYDGEEGVHFRRFHAVCRANMTGTLACTAARH